MCYVTPILNKFDRKMTTLVIVGIYKPKAK